MILASQKCVFDKQGLGFKYSKNQKHFKNYFVKESLSASSSTTCNFYGRGRHISSTCPLRNGSQKNSNAKSKKVWIEKSKVTNPQGPKKIWVPKSTWVLFCRVQKRISGYWIVDAQDTWPKINPSFFSLQKKKKGYITFGDNAKGRIIGQCNISNSTSSLIESVLLVDGLKHNLLSISQLCDKSFKVIF